jgi:GNAT superfamily N-acetyltransferase
VNQIQIREATAADLPQLRVFEQNVVAAERPFNDRIKSGTVHYYDIAAMIDSDESLVLVAADGGRLIGSGYASLQESKAEFAHDRHAWLGFMFIEPNYRGQGLIQQIIGQLLAWAREAGVRDHYLDVYAENEAAVRAYEKFGFQRNLLEMKISD